MRYYSKKTREQQPRLFHRWKEENRMAIEEWRQNDQKTAAAMWDQLGKTFSEERDTDIDPLEFKRQLQTAFFEEQHGLCCYCGDKIERNFNEIIGFWQYSDCSIEHFLAKAQRKDQVFEYDNLLLCCKESRKIAQYEVGRVTQDGFRIIDFQSVALRTGLPESKLKSYDKNRALLNRPLQMGDRIYVPRPPHCDDNKSIFDARPEGRTIINPTQDQELINMLLFLPNGSIDYVGRQENRNEVIENTLETV